MGSSTRLVLSALQINIDLPIARAELDKMYGISPKLLCCNQDFSLMPSCIMYDEAQGVLGARGLRPWIPG